MCPPPDNADNSLQVCAPGTAYNCISVGAYRNGIYYNSIGPTLDNGRCKPDITAPAGATSFSTPQVSGAVALLMQAALRGDGGSDTNSAFDLRTIKALLLNGAVKPADWTNSNSSPLDARYGAGVLNVFNAYEQLAGGKNNSCATNLISLGAAHPPAAVTNTISSGSGWNFQTLASSATNDAVNDYFFNASNGAVTATLVWNRQLGQTNINDLDLFLFNAANSNLVACSTSRVDNVEHIFVPQLAAGRYDLQVLKNGGTNVVSDAETYALAWAFVSPTLSIADVRNQRDADVAGLSGGLCGGSDDGFGFVGLDHQQSSVARHHEQHEQPDFECDECAAIFPAAPAEFLSRKAGRAQNVFRFCSCWQWPP